MEERIVQTVLAYERPAKSFSHIAYELPFDRARDMALASAEANAQSWIGDVVYDQTRDVIDPAPQILCERCPFVLVCRWEDFDYAGHGNTVVTVFTDARVLFERAAQVIADDRAAGIGSIQLCEVYGVRVRIHRAAS